MPPRRKSAPTRPLDEVVRLKAPGKFPLYRLTLSEKAGQVALELAWKKRYPRPQVWVFDLATGAKVRPLQRSEGISGAGALEYLPDGTLLVAWYDFDPGIKPVNAVQAIDPAGKVLWEHREPGITHLNRKSLLSLAGPGGQVALVTARGAALGVAGATGLRLERTVGGPCDAYPFVALSPDGQRVVWAPEEDDAQGHEAASGKLLWKHTTLSDHPGPRGLRWVGFGPQGRWFGLLRLLHTDLPSGQTVTTCRDLVLLDPTSGQPAAPELRAACKDLTCFAASRGTPWCAAGFEDGSVLLVDTASGASSRHPLFGGEALSCLYLSDDARWLGVASETGDVRVLLGPGVGPLPAP